MADPITILLIDDHRVVRQGVRAFLSTQPDLAVVGEAESGAQGVELAARLVPDVALMDLVMPGMDGVEATRQLKRTLAILAHAQIIALGPQKAQVEQGLPLSLAIAAGLRLLNGRLVVRLGLGEVAQCLMHLRACAQQGGVGWECQVPCRLKRVRQMLDRGARGIQPRLFGSLARSGQRSGPILGGKAVRSQIGQPAIADSLALLLHQRCERIGDLPMQQATFTSQQVRVERLAG